MINLLYHSHTVVPAHLEELVGLGLLERDEQVLAAFDGVLMDGRGQRVSGPTLHDYCLLTNLRVVLWARDYGRHLCYAFPLTELRLVDGTGLDPLHAYIQFGFAAPNEEEQQQFMLTLLPLRDLPAALRLLRCAGEAAQILADHGADPYEAGVEITGLLVEQIFGSVDGRIPTDTPYRWPGATAPAAQPDPAFQYDPANVPPEQIYAAGRLARSAWDTLRRSLREAELPFDLNGGNLRDLADTVRAVNDLITTVASNPGAREMAMAFLNRRSGGNAPGSSVAEEPPPASEPAPAPPPSEYREIPLRRKGQPIGTAPCPEAPPVELKEIPLRRRSQPTPPPARPETAPTERGEIPLRRRGQPITRPIFTGSGSGDAERDG